MNVQVEPGAILVLVRGAVEEHHLALVPSLVRLADVREVEAGRAVRGVSGHAGHSPLVTVAAVSRVALVPDVDRDIQPLHTIHSSADGTDWRATLHI